MKEKSHVSNIIKAIEHLDINQLWLSIPSKMRLAGHSKKMFLDRLEVYFDYFKSRGEVALKSECVKYRQNTHTKMQSFMFYSEWLNTCIAFTLGTKKDHLCLFYEFGHSANERAKLKYPNQLIFVNKPAKVEVLEGLNTPELAQEQLECLIDFESSEVQLSTNEIYDWVHANYLLALSPSTLFSDDETITEYYSVFCGMVLYLNHLDFDYCNQLAYEEYAELKGKAWELPKLKWVLKHKFLLDEYRKIITQRYLLSFDSHGCCLINKYQIISTSALNIYYMGCEIQRTWNNAYKHFRQSIGAPTVLRKPNLRTRISNDSFKSILRKNFSPLEYIQHFEVDNNWN